MSNNNDQLSQTFNLPTLDELNFNDEAADALLDSLTDSNKVNEEQDVALVGFIDHDDEMDNFAQEAFDSYKDMFGFAMASPPRDAAAVFQASEAMLKLAVEAKNSKIDKKIKMLDLQLKQRKLQLEEQKERNKMLPKTINDAPEDSNGVAMSREDLLAAMLDADTDDDK